MGRIVIACYRPKPGATDALHALVRTHVPRLRAEGLVTDRAPIAMAAEDGTVVEVFEWASREAIERAHASPVVHAMWEEFGAVCDYVPIASVAEASALFSEMTPLD
ncbi:MAG: antibiotic biosynthesis monooxygenase [Sandaracinus sp.]|nr:antibiotic biosynthesis monooxygenase [Myxococcales bacterium]MCB9604635.1 antibiotic biosynthesis monooxygenase [Sandaracinus sp.]MCB9614059.1 antibiotic biosynthesis monooxygenase [Sandaracinus sp.]